MYLNQVLIPKNNNFDVFRLIAALMVIYGHAPAFFPGVASTDIVARLLGFDYSGSLAVKFFFMLSGLLVTTSILARPNVGEFVFKRVVRIIPGLFVCLCISVFFVGAFFTQLPIVEYFSQKATWNYLFHNTILHPMEWFLPGVFTESKHGVNGSLWTLPLEFVCYFFLAAFYGVGIWRIKLLANALLVGVIILSFFSPHILPPLFSNDEISHMLPGCFALGALFATNQNLIVISKQGFFSLGLLCALLWFTEVKVLTFYILFFYACIYFSSCKLIIEKLKIPADPSYGVYIYGFVIQQSLAHLFPAQGVILNQIFSAILAVIAGLISWFLIEKPSMKFAKSLLAKNDTASFPNIEITNKLGSVMSYFKGKNILMFFSLIFFAWAVHFLALYLIFPGHYSPLSFHHADFYIPLAFANAPGEAYSFVNLLNWPRPLFMYSYKISGYLGQAGSVAWVVGIVFLNCTLMALLLKRMLGLNIDRYFYLFYGLYCYLLFTQPYFYTFYSQDIGSQLSFLLLLLGSISFINLVEKNNIAAGIVFFLFGTAAFLVKETYILSIGFITFCWFLYYLKKNLLRALLPGLAILPAGIIAALVNFKSKSVFVNLEAKTGTSYHIDFSFVSVLKEIARYSSEAITPMLVVVFGLILFQIHKTYRDKFLISLFLMCCTFALLAWLPNALLPFHHYEGYSFNGLYVCMAVLFFVVKILQHGIYSQRIVWAIVVLIVLSPLTSIKKYKGTRNTWVIGQESIQVNMLAGFNKAAAQLIPLEKNVTVLITGITAPFHPFSFPESIRAFSGAEKATYYFVVPKDFPNNVGNKVDLVNFIADADSSTIVYDQEWQFDDQGNLVAIKNKP